MELVIRGMCYVLVTIVVVILETVKKISGENGRRLTIKSNSNGGMNTIDVTTTGKTRAWKMKKSSTGDVKFVVLAHYDYTCTSTGVIKLHK